jgi:hypothetical protein
MPLQTLLLCPAVAHSEDEGQANPNAQSRMVMERRAPGLGLQVETLQHSGQQGAHHGGLLQIQDQQPGGDGGDGLARQV